MSRHGLSDFSFFPLKFGRDDIGDIGERLHVSAQVVTGSCCSHPVASPNIGVGRHLKNLNTAVTYFSSRIKFKPFPNWSPQGF